MAAFAAFAGFGVAGTSSSAAEYQYGPTNTSAPTISGTPQVGNTLTANPGTWSGSGTITYAYQWQRCDANGPACLAVAGGTNQAYVVSASDVGRTLRVVVTARDTTGAGTATSALTAAVVAGGPAGAIKLSNGKTSIPVSSVSLPNRLVIDSVRFTPSPVTSRNRPLSVRVHISDTRGFWIRGALVFARSTPLVTTTPGEHTTNTSGYVTLRMSPKSIFPLRRGYSVQFFLRARKAGEPMLAGISSRRLAQVATR